MTVFWTSDLKLLPKNREKLSRLWLECQGECVCAVLVESVDVASIVVQVCGIPKWPIPGAGWETLASLHWTLAPVQHCSSAPRWWQEDQAGPFSFVIFCEGWFSGSSLCVSVPLCRKSIVSQSYCLILTLTLSLGLGHDGPGTQWDWNTMGRPCHFFYVLF